MSMDGQCLEGQTKLRTIEMTCIAGLMVRLNMSPLLDFFPQLHEYDGPHGVGSGALDSRTMLSNKSQLYF